MVMLDEEPDEPLCTMHQLCCVPGPGRVAACRGAKQLSSKSHTMQDASHNANLEQSYASKWPPAEPIGLHGLPIPVL